jgi:hypothetical protein
MKKTVFVIVMALLTMLNVTAQKVKIESGNLAFLKGQANINFNFDYSGMKVDGKSEKAYVDEQVKSKNKEEKGSGDEWKTNWDNSYRTDFFQKKVIEDFNEATESIALEGGYFEDAPYTVTIKITVLDPGVSAGPFTRPSEVSIEAIFTKTNSTDVLTKIVIEEAKSSKYDVANNFYDAGRIASAFGEAGENLADAVIKALKKVK